MTKKQPKKSVETDDNFLDHDELEMVSSDRHAWAFDQIIMVAEPIPQDEKVMVTWTVPNFYHTVAVIRTLAEDYDVSITLLIQAALEHGVAMFEHKHSDTITFLSNLDRAALTNGTMRYFDHSFRIGFGRDVGKYPAICSAATSTALTNLSGQMRAAKRNVAGACILMSLCTDTQIPKEAYKELETHLKKIELTISVQKLVATSLI